MTGEAKSTRERIWAELEERYDRRELRMSAWASTNLIAQISDAEWTAMHAGTCALCGAEGARLYPRGWRCTTCLAA